MNTAAKPTTEIVRRLVHVIGVNFRTVTVTGTAARSTTAKFYLYYSFLAIGFIQMLLSAVLHSHEFYKMANPAAYMSETLIDLANMLYFYKHQTRIARLLHALDSPFSYPASAADDLPRLGSSKRPPDRSRRSANRVNLLVLLYECAGFATAGLAPILGMLNTKKPSLIYPGWYPWDISDGKCTVFVTYLTQAVVTCSVFYSYYLIQAFMVFATMEVLIEFKQLRRALKSLHRRSLRATCDRLGIVECGSWRQEKWAIRTEAYRRIYMENFLRCCKHHQALVVSFTSFKSWFDVLNAVELIGSTLTFALVFYCLFEAETLEQYVSLVGAIMVGVLNLFSRCYVGELYAEIHGKLADTIFYKTNWYDQTLYVRRMLIMLHMRMSKPLRLSGVNIYQASFYTFAAVSRLSYSYLNLIRASLLKHKRRG